MSEKKLTPKEAFEHLQAVFPWIMRIERSNKHEGGVFFRDREEDVGFHLTRANIDWGDATSYKPEKWRPATIEDVVRHMNGEYVEARIGNRTGRLFGVSKPGTVIAFGVDFGDESAWGGGSKVEVRDE